jgi:hypothetical protein
METVVMAMQHKIRQSNASNNRQGCVLTFWDGQYLTTNHTSFRIEVNVIKNKREVTWEKTQPGERHTPNQRQSNKKRSVNTRPECISLLYSLLRGSSDSNHLGVHVGVKIMCVCVDV